MIENDSRLLVHAENSSRPPAHGRRRRYIDCARGLAVLLMIEAHTVDAWTRLDVRHTLAFRNATILGGFAAPLFLWLAGAGVALAAARTAERRDRRAAAAALCRRGLEIFALAFLFRLQALMLTPGGALIGLFRVDILNVMGPAMIAAGLLWSAVPNNAARVVAFSVATALVAMTTPIVRASSTVELLPAWIQWYVRPAGEMTTFTLFPWAAFVFAGAAVGVLTSASTDDRSERRMHAALAVVAALLIAVGFWTASRPTIYAASSFWTSSPTWFAIRVGILTIALTALYGIEIAAGKSSHEDTNARTPVVAEWKHAVQSLVSSWEIPLARLGRASLFIYWIHVELVYGYTSWLWRHRLPLWGTTIACLAFCVAMYEAIAVRDWMMTRRRPRRPATATATA